MPVRRAGANVARGPLFIGLALAAFVACAGAPDSDRFDPAACASFVVPSTWSLGWQNLNHRISRWVLRLEPSPGPTCDVDALAVGFVGGDFSTGETATDVPRVDWHGARVDEVDPAALGAARRSVDVEVGPTGEATTTLRWARADLRLRGYPTVVALLEGLALRTDVAQGPDYPADYDPALGYTSRGLGAWARVVALDEQGVEVEVGVRFAHGPSDRADMNAAIPFARAAATVDLLLVGVADAPVIEGGVATRVVCPKPAFLIDVPCPEPDPADTRLVLEAPPGPWRGPVGWTSFRFQLDAVEQPGNGEYLRELRVALDVLEHDPDTGRATFRLLGHASHASKFVAFSSLESRFEGAIAWIPAVVEAARLQVTGPFETGDSLFALTPEAP
jgi:hypothetical protein